MTEYIGARKKTIEDVKNEREFLKEELRKEVQSKEYWKREFWDALEQRGKAKAHANFWQNAYNNLVIKHAREEK